MVFIWEVYRFFNNNSDKITHCYYWSSCWQTLVILKKKVAKIDPIVGLYCNLKSLYIADYSIKLTTNRNYRGKCRLLSTNFIPSGMVTKLHVYTHPPHVNNVKSKWYNIKFYTLQKKVINWNFFISHTW